MKFSIVEARTKTYELVVMDAGEPREPGVQAFNMRSWRPATAEDIGTLLRHNPELFEQVMQHVRCAAAGPIAGGGK